MLPLERQNQILDILAQRKAVTVDELCHLLYSSGATIRRDLAILENNGQLKRTHGGAVFLDASSKDYPLMLRENENLLAKETIARKALPLIRDGQTLFLDSSSTVLKLAELLNGFNQLRVITNGLKTASLLADVDGVELHCTGGRLRENAKSFIGQSVNRFVDHFNADYAFISCKGADPGAGVTEASEEEADVKLSYIQKCPPRSAALRFLQAGQTILLPGCFHGANLAPDYQHQRAARRLRRTAHHRKPGKQPPGKGMTNGR